MNKTACGFSRPSRLLFTLLQWLSLLLLLAGTLYQGYRFLGVATREVPKVWKTIGGSRLWRSANYAQNKRFADYVIFLNETIPQKARVVLPPENIGPRLLGHVPYMQYFLMPREVLNCSEGEAACLQRFSENGAYVVVVNPDFFPGSNASQYTDRLRMFDMDWGVLLPQGTPDVSGWTESGFATLAEIVRQLLFPWLWLALLCLPGWILARRILTSHGELVVAFVGTCLGLGVLSFGLYIGLLFSQYLSRGLLMVVTVVWWALALSLWGRLPVPQRGSRHLRIDPWQIFILSLVLVNAFLAVGKSYFAADELIIWANKGYAIAEVGLSEGVSAWGLSSWKYTLNIPLLIAAFRQGFGDLLPASKVIFPLYYGALLVGIYTFLKQHTSPNVAGLATLAYGTTALILRHATIGYANLPFVACFVLATTLALEELQREGAGYSVPHLLLAGVLYALGAWSRVEGLVIGLLMGTIIAYCGWRAKGKSWLKAALWLAAPLALLSLVWLLTSDLAYTQPRTNSGVIITALAQMLQGNLHLVEGIYALRWLVSSLATFDTWGVIGLAVLLLSWLPLKKNRGNLVRWILWLCGGVVLLTGLGTVYASSYTTGCDVSCWVRTGLDRYVLLGVTLLYLESVRRVFGNSEV